MPLPWQQPVKDFASMHVFQFWKNEKLHFLKTTQSIYLLKFNGLCLVKKINKVLAFNITNGKG